VKEVLPGCGKKDATIKFQGYINVEKTGVCCSAEDKRVINRLKYMKQQKAASGPLYTTDKKGERKRLVRKKRVIPAKWIGYSNQTGKYIDLTDTWVAQI
jgi:hypothetical protein